MIRVVMQRWPVMAIGPLPPCRWSGLCRVLLDTDPGSGA